MMVVHIYIYRSGGAVSSGAGSGSLPVSLSSHAPLPSTHPRTQSQLSTLFHPLQKVLFSLTEERSAGISGACDGDVSLDWSPVLWISLPHWVLGLPVRHSRSHVSTTVTPHTLPRLTVPDLTPNVGLFWYFFTEAFEHFRVFFLCVFQINAFLYVLPLSFRFRY